MQAMQQGSLQPLRKYMRVNAGETMWKHCRVLLVSTLYVALLCMAVQLGKGGGKPATVS